MENLAAWGISVAFALIIEAPVIMLLSAATALVRDKTSYLALRRFTFILNVVLTGVMVLVLVPPVFRFLTGTLLNLPADVAELVYGAMTLLLPWPAAIGYRRFLQGTLVRHDMTRRVAYGTPVAGIAIHPPLTVVPWHDPFQKGDRAAESGYPRPPGLATTPTRRISGE